MTQQRQHSKRIAPSTGRGCLQRKGSVWYIHPVAAANGAVGLGGFGCAALGDLAARAGDTPGSSATRLLLLFLNLSLTGIGLSHGLGILLVLVHGPVEDVVVLETFADEQITEDLAEVAVVGLIVESDRKSTRLNSSHSGESRMPSSA